VSQWKEVTFESGGTFEETSASSGGTMSIVPPDTPKAGEEGNFGFGRLFFGFGPFGGGIVRVQVG